MSTIKDYSIIEIKYLKEKINRIAELDEANFGKWSECLIILKEIESKCKPLTPIIENALTYGMLIQRTINDKVKIPAFRIKDYINNTIIE
jgi:hypothetical protein